MMGRLLRAAGVLQHVGIGLGLAGGISVLGPRRMPPPAIGPWWARRLMRLCQIDVQVSGQPLTGARLEVANHISWLDMFGLATQGHIHYVAKSEVGRWPIVRNLADAMDTIYIKRGQGGAASVLTQSGPRLRSGGFFLFFPEGTTTAGQDVGKFHARLFAAAVDAGVPVQPIALRYREPDPARPVAPFVGDDDLLNHLLRLLGRPGLTLEIIYCAPIAPGPDADELSRLARERIIQARQDSGETVRLAA